MSTETMDRPAPSLDTLQAAWKAHNNHSSYEHTQHILLYALIKTNMLESPAPNFNAIGLKILVRLKKAFPSIVRQSKLTNGRYPYDTLEQILSQLCYISPMKTVPGREVFGIKLDEQAEKNFAALAKWIRDELRMERKNVG